MQYYCVHEQQTTLDHREDLVGLEWRLELCMKLTDLEERVDSVFFKSGGGIARNIKETLGDFAANI